jgi:hypothetical protein
MLSSKKLLLYFWLGKRTIIKTFDDNETLTKIEHDIEDIMLLLDH